VFIANKSYLFEHFWINKGITLIRDSQKQNIVIENGTYDESILNFVNLAKDKYQIIRTASPNANDIVCSSILSIPDNSQLLAVTNDQMICCFLRHSQSVELKTIVDILKTETKIYYINNNDFKLIMGIAASTEIPISTQYTQSWVKVNDIEDAKRHVFSETPSNEVLFWSGNPKDPRTKEALSQQSCSIIPFDESKNDLIRFFLPEVVIGNYDWKLLFIKNIDRFSVKKTLFYRNVLTMKETYPQTYLLKYIIRFFEKNKDFMSYYETKKKKIHPIAYKILWQSIESFESYTKNGNISVESFITFEPQHEVRVFLDSRTDELFLTEPKKITDIDLHIGDVVILGQQKRKIENGTWKIIRYDTKEKFLVAKRTSQDADKWNMFKDDKYDPRYNCYGESQYVIKGLCESEVDLNGNTKEKGVWDRPCDHDKECPFFQKNTNYKNYRGSCNSGYCELPLGVMRTGYRTYKGNPFCHGCTIDNPRCCETQKQPDYAFVFDEYERRPKTILESFSPISKVNNKEFISGEFSDSVIENQYHNEMTNTEFTQLLRKLHGNSLSLDLSSIVEFDVLLENFLVMMPELELEEFSCYDVMITSKDISLTDILSINYSVDVTLYREGKSHGKRVRFYIYHNSKSNTFTIKNTQVLGFVPEYDIARDVNGNDSNIKKHTLQNHGISCVNAELETIIHPYDDPEEYICETVGKKLGVDRNIIMPECSLYSSDPNLS
jgi:hypothetical protein